MYIHIYIYIYIYRHPYLRNLRDLKHVRCNLATDSVDSPRWKQNKPIANVTLALRPSKSKAAWCVPSWRHLGSVATIFEWPNSDFTFLWCHKGDLVRILSGSPGALPRSLLGSFKPDCVETLSLVLLRFHTLFQHLTCFPQKNSRFQLYDFDLAAPYCFLRWKTRNRKVGSFSGENTNIFSSEKLPTLRFWVFHCK